MDGNFGAYPNYIPKMKFVKKTSTNPKNMSPIPVVKFIFLFKIIYIFAINLNKIIFLLILKFLIIDIFLFLSFYLFYLFKGNLINLL